SSSRFPSRPSAPHEAPRPAHAPEPFVTLAPARHGPARRPQQRARILRLRRTRIQRRPSNGMTEREDGLREAEGPTAAATDADAVDPNAIDADVDVAGKGSD